MSDAWVALRRVTAARIALGHTGASLPTNAHLEFQLAHARARDAVAYPLDVNALMTQLSALDIESVSVTTEAADRTAFLANPARGGRLDAASKEILAARTSDVAFVIADGLSAAAVARHAPPLLALAGARTAVIVTQGRVAIGDEVGALLQAELAVVLIGERPGLSAPDSLGVYITYKPRPGRSNAERNCISNIRPEGLPYEIAADKLLWLMAEARRRGLTGVALKEEA